MTSYKACLVVVLQTSLFIASSMSGRSQGVAQCPTTGGRTCVFPFKWGSSSYTACDLNDARYNWCATTLTADGEYDDWDYCEPALCSRKVRVAENSCSFNDEELAPPRTFQRSPHETSEEFVWPNGEIPYVFTWGMDKGDRKLFEANMRKIEKNSCFRFKKQDPYNKPPRDGRKYLEIQIPKGAKSCADARGLVFSARVSNTYLLKKNQYLRKNALLLKSDYKLTDKAVCRRKEYKGMFEGGILHEMFHALGVGHTQRRKDRDNFITINSGNIISQKKKQYEVCKGCKVYNDLPYECNSVMHYGYMTFAKKQEEGFPTMKAKDPKTCKITATGYNVPTKNDWKLIKKIGNTVC